MGEDRNIPLNFPSKGEGKEDLERRIIENERRTDAALKKTDKHDITLHELRTEITKVGAIATSADRGYEKLSSRLEMFKDDVKEKVNDLRIDQKANREAIDSIRKQNFQHLLVILGFIVSSMGFIVLVVRWLIGGI